MVIGSVKALWLELLVGAALAAALVVALTPLVRLLARRVGAVAYPKDDRWHKHPVPTLGGIAIFACNGRQSRPVWSS